MNDSALVEGFLRGTLESFPHRDHVRTAYLLLSVHDFEEATRILSDRIRAMAAAGGDPDKFHVTRTVAWMRLIDLARTDDRAVATSNEFLQLHPELLQSNLLDAYYSGELLRSPDARARFVEPDLAPLSSRAGLPGAH
jgi:hypothetical protein